MKKQQKGFSLIELLIVVAIILIIAAIAIPNLMRSKMMANEASAVAALRTMNTLRSRLLDDLRTISRSLGSLGPMTGTSPTSATADLIDSVLAGGTKSRIQRSRYAGTVSSGVVRNVQYHCRKPVTQGVSGQRSFYTERAV